MLAGGAKLRRAVLGHLSRDCNRPDLAIQTVRTQGGEGAGTLEIIAASQAEISACLTVEERAPEPIILEPEPAVSPRVAEAPPTAQMDLFGALAF